MLLRAVQRGAARARHGTARALSNVPPKIPKLSPEQMDAAIKEMNEEMEELFGGGPARDPVGSSMSSAPHMGETFMSARAAEAQALEALAAQERAAPPPRPSHDTGSARAALLARINSCSTELAGADVEIDRATRLAECVAACAKAVAALEELK